jgi:predicted aldo/keto reductase-like oxidoreductase
MRIEMEGDMKSSEQTKEGRAKLTRRRFMEIGGMAVAGASLPATAWGASPEGKDTDADKQMIKETRILGRTGFAASDIGMGAASLKENNLVRYAYDRGVNYFDTASTYGNGASETSIGKAMPFMDRKKIFISTKIDIRNDDTEQSLLDKFAQSQERLNTPYIDALLIAGVTNVNQLYNETYHAAVKTLKTDGRLKHAGVSCHGPRGMGDSMEKVLVSAADDGRFDLVLLVYNFLNKEEGERVLAACKKKNIGTTAMKTAPGKIKEIPTFDPENPSKEYEERIKMMMSFELPREEAIQMVKGMVESEKAAREQTKPFLTKYGLKTEDQLWEASVKWVRQNTDMHSVCISMTDFDRVDKAVELSGKNLTKGQQAFLRDYEKTLSWSYCRHGCSQCSGTCEYALPISTIMRYAYYYEQGYEKLAMEKYASLKENNAMRCAWCTESCAGACPYGVMIRSNLLNAHTLLTLA